MIYAKNVKEKESIAIIYYLKLTNQVKHHCLLDEKKIWIAMIYGI